jgi:putative tryptophan/tyrosine transport system substrate-binding protein
VLSFLSKHGKHSAVKRREFIKVLGGAAAAWPLTLLAQQVDRIRRVGILMGPSQNDPETKGRLEAFERGLKNLGWDQGRNVHLDVRYAVAGFNAQTLAKELIALGPDVLLANSTPMACRF